MIRTRNAFQLILASLSNQSNSRTNQLREIKNQLSFSFKWNNLECLFIHIVLDLFFSMPIFNHDPALRRMDHCFSMSFVLDSFYVLLMCFQAMHTKTRSNELFHSQLSIKDYFISAFFLCLRRWSFIYWQMKMHSVIYKILAFALDRPE